MTRRKERQRSPCLKKPSSAAAIATTRLRAKVVQARAVSHVVPAQVEADERRHDQPAHDRHDAEHVIAALVRQRLALEPYELIEPTIMQELLLQLTQLKSRDDLLVLPLLSL